MADNNLDALVVRSVTDLMWLTGFEYVFDSEQAHLAVITANECIMHTDFRYSNAAKIAAAKEGLWKIDDALQRPSKFLSNVLTQNSIDSSRVGIDNMTPLALYRAFKKYSPNAQFIELQNFILNLRAQKDEYEIGKIKAAQQCAENAFKDLLKQISAGMSEKEVSLLLEFLMRRGGADELAFPNIVASGPNSANPHAVPSNRTLQSGDFVVFDFGARIDGYCSDTTRTICIGKPSSYQKQAYNAVRQANEEVEKSLAAGVCSKDMHNLAEEVLKECGFEGKMGHALGHGVGLDIHENPTLSPRSDEILKENSIVTVEPGVYLDGKFGIRLEDFGVICMSSFDNFCQLPHDLYILE